MNFSRELTAEQYVDYLRSFGEVSKAILLPYREAALKRFSPAEGERIANTELDAIEFCIDQKFELAAEAYSRDFDEQIAKTFDIVPRAEWKRALPTLGSDASHMIQAMSDNNWPHLKKVFELALH